MEIQRLSKIKIKLLIFGYDNVGKKSITKRLAILNASETKVKLVKHEIPGTPLLKTILKTNNKFKDLAEVRKSEKKKAKEKDLCSFEKIYTIGKFYISISPVIMKKPEPILFTDQQNVLEELEENEKEHKLKFDVVKKEVKEITNNISDTEDFNYDQVFYIFMFVYDLSNLDSFEKIKFYHSELERTFNISSNPNYGVVFLGNKVDNKLILSDQELPYKNFFDRNNLLNYEISTGMYFSFEKLFKGIYSNIIEPKNNELGTKFYKDKFDNVLFQRKSFPKAEKNKLTNLNFPGPKYDVEIYSATQNTKDIKKAYSKKERFNYKTFMNKTGPVFYKPKSDIHNKEDSETVDNKRVTTQKQINLQNNEQVQGKNGFSLGVKPAYNKYRKLRREKMNKLLKSYEELFNLENLTNLAVNHKDKPERTDCHFSRDKMKEYLKKKEKLIENEYDIKILQENAKLRRQELEDEKREKIEEMKTKQEENYNKYIERTNQFWERKRKVSASKPKIQKEVTYPSLYNTTKDFIFVNKKFSMRGKYLPDQTYNKYYPEMRKIESDIEYTAKHGNLR